MILILSGPSGVGKDTVIDAWRHVNPLVERVVAVTTRQPRADEVHGVHYRFVPLNAFLQMVDQGEFLEHKLVHGHWYGTPWSSVDRLVAEGKIAVLKIDVQGAEEVKRVRPDVVRVFLMAPSLDDLRDRLSKRGTDPADDIERRLRNATREIEAAESYDHHLVNDRVDEVVLQLEKIVSQVRA